MPSFVFMRGPYWAKDPDEATTAAAKPFNKYFYDGFMDQFAKAHTKGLRAIPIDRTVEDPRRILPYEDVVKFVDSQDYCTVSYCPCRQRKRLDPDSEVCDHPMEVCLHFGRLGHYIVENGLGREITREETKEILTQAAESGLVHAISNWQEGADTICNCCQCCCLFFEAYHVLNHAKSHDVSNYQVRHPKRRARLAVSVSSAAPWTRSDWRIRRWPPTKRARPQRPISRSASAAGCAFTSARPSPWCSCGAKRPQSLPGMFGNGWNAGTRIQGFGEKPDGRDP